jgi:diguanylate cyclase (GGDEF)-like protein/PAS domain S-box-containing protein
MTSHDEPRDDAPAPLGLPSWVDGGRLLDITPGCTVVAGEDGLILHASAGAVELLGVDPRGRSLGELFPGLPPASDAARTIRAACSLPDGSELTVEGRLATIEEPAPLSVFSFHAIEASPDGPGGNETTFRSVVEQISAITYTWTWHDGAYEVVYTSPQIERILGYKPADWIANPIAWYDWVHPEDRPDVIEQNKRCEQTGESHSMQYRMLRRDGRIVWVEDSWVVVDDAGIGRMFQGVVFDITERKLAEEEIAFLARHDRLTGLVNRASFEEMLEMAISRARRHDLGVGVLYLDLDNFKLVNDSLGHHAGDQLLIQLASRLLTCTRAEDLVARQGGDEFLMLLADLERGLQEMSVAEMVAERVRTTLRDPFDIEGTQFFASGSIGISIFPQDGLDADTLLRNADSAMYRAKRFTPGAHLRYGTSEEEPMERLSMSTRLRRAVDEENWVLHYQPVVDLSDGRMRGVEALIRWQDPNGGLVAPGQFIPLAEELGLIEAIGDWVIDEMARQQNEWAESGLDLEVSFNLSPRQLWSAHLAERVIGKLSATGVDPGRVVVEITESSAMAEPDRTQKILSELHAFGLTLAIDDFGTGYSSLARLQHMPVDILKIDRSFVRDVDKETGQAGMVRSMIQLAQSLNMMPLAEGIETPGESIFLRSNGCRLAQGFLFARPVLPAEIPDLAAREGGLIPESALS